MAKDTITKIWASNAVSNRKLFNDDEIGAGIQYEGPVVSNELNGIANRADIMIDNLQRGHTPWNAAKEYNRGDSVVACVSINGVSHLCVITSTMGRNSNLPFSGHTNADTDALFATFTFDSFEAIQNGSGWEFKTIYIQNLRVKMLSAEQASFSGSAVNVASSAFTWDNWDAGGNDSVESAGNDATSVATKGWVRKYLAHSTDAKFKMISQKEFEALTTEQIDSGTFYFVY